MEVLRVGADTEECREADILQNMLYFNSELNVLLGNTNCCASPVFLSLKPQSWMHVSVAPSHLDNSNMATMALYTIMCLCHTEPCVSAYKHPPRWSFTTSIPVNTGWSWEAPTTT